MGVSFAIVIRSTQLTIDYLFTCCDIIADDELIQDMTKYIGTFPSYPTALMTTLYNLIEQYTAHSSINPSIFFHFFVSTLTGKGVT